MKIFSQQSLISILPLSIFFSFLNPSIGKADVIVPGTVRVDYCFKITNLDKYPDYWFILLKKSPVLRTPWNLVLKSGKCHDLGGYRIHGEVYALKKSDVNLEDNVVNDGEFEEFKNFESYKAKLIPAKDKIHPVESIEESFSISRVEKVIDSMEIKSLDDKALILSKKDRSYSLKPMSPLFPTLGISSIGGLLIGGVIYWKKSGKSKKVD